MELKGFFLLDVAIILFSLESGPQETPLCGKQWKAEGPNYPTIEQAEVVAAGSTREAVRT